MEVPLRAYVRVRDPAGAEWELGHGDLVGRLPWAGLVLDDPRVSEAHAMISLRGEQLQLVALRRPVRLDGQRLGEITLAAGQRVEFAEGVEVTVLEVVLPDRVASISGDDLALQVLAPAVSLWTKPRPRVVPVIDPGADAWLWRVGEQWRVRVTTDTAPTLLRAGEAFVVDGRRFELGLVPLQSAAGARTAVGAVDAPLRIVARYDTVHIVRDGLPTVILAGLQARLISELVATRQPIGWHALVQELWPQLAEDSHGQRRRLDMTLLRLRRRLEAEGIRTDLVAALGTGLLELSLRADDQLVDEL